MKLSGFALDGVQQRLPSGVALYVVGGAVRDELLGARPDDRDWVVVGATPQAMLDAGFTPVGSGFPVFLHPETHEEYALARTERKHGHGYKGFTFHADPSVTLEEDLARRDFTLNAMAKNAEGVLFDPWGGLADLQQGLLRHVGPAFVEDPLRVLRLARFLARWPQFNVHPDTWALCQQIAAQGELAHLVPERVLAELQRAMREAAPSRAWALLARLRFWTVLLLEPHPWDQPQDAFLQDLDAHSSPNARWLCCVAQLPDELALKPLQQRLKWPTELLQNACVLLRCRDFLQRVATLCLQTEGVEAVLAVLHAVDCFRKPERLHEVLQFLALGASTHECRLLQVLQMAVHSVQCGEYHHDLRLVLQASEGKAAVPVPTAVHNFKLQWVRKLLATPNNA